MKDNLLKAQERKRKDEEWRKQLEDEAEFIRIHSPEIRKEEEERRAFAEEQKRNDEKQAALEQQVEKQRDLEWELICRRDASLISMMRQDYGDQLLSIFRAWEAKLFKRILFKRKNCFE